MTAVLTPPTDTAMEAVARARRDLIAASKKMTDREARYLVDFYYQGQDQRIRLDGQVRSAGKAGEPSNMLDWYADQFDTIESSLKSALRAYASSRPLGQWAMSIHGIGPVITAGLIANLDVTRPSVAQIWRFCGMDPTMEWKKGQKRPWNAGMKRLAWLIGTSFVKMDVDKCWYRKMYDNRKIVAQAKNNSGEYRVNAERALERKKFRDDTKAKAAYLEGRLPDGHIHAQCVRWVAKLFLSHFHTVGHYLATGSVPVRPYAFDRMEGHKDLYLPLNMDEVPGLEDALRREWLSHKV